MRAIKVLSLFDGISCARVALDRLGYAVEYYASEIDKYAISIAQKNYPDTIQLGSVTEFDLSFLPTDIDLLIGGSPCQDLSIAKANRKGLDGERSGLFWRYVEIWKAVKPKYFVLENVNSMPKDAKRIITETMGVEPIMINAALVSAQNRKRLFWTNIATDVFGNCHIPQPEDRGILLKDVLESGTAQDEINKSYCIDANYYKGGKKDTHNQSGKRLMVIDNIYPSGGTARDVYITQRGRGFNKGGDRARDGKAPTLSANSWEDNNHIVIRSDPKMTEPIRIGDIGSNSQGYRVYSQDGKSVTLSVNGGGPGAKTGLYAVACAKRSRYKASGNRSKFSEGGTEKVTEVSEQEKAHAMTSVQTDSMVATNHTIRKLTPVECERLQSLPDGYTEGISNTQRYKCLGNAFNVEVVRHILSFINIT